jgi:hypothetical protein
MSEAVPTHRVDPLRIAYAAAERWEKVSDVVSWCSIGAFSAYTYFHMTDNELQSLAKLVFVGLAAFCVCCGYWLRLEIQPRIDRQRRLLLLSDSFGAGYALVKQEGYYTSRIPAGPARLMINLAENTFFYPKLLRKDAVRPLIFVIVSIIGLFIGVRYGTAEVVEMLALLLLFGELGLGRLLRIFWMIREFEGLHEEQLRWFREGSLCRSNADMEVLRLLTEYECVKSRGGVRARDKTFERMNTELSAEWERIGNMVLADANL